ncbi:MAG: DNA/RNA nuclease SfsA [Schwartzia sp.]|nr:DNA/RNA nuclease SfsA [Schwartzia sp. (in: firmicutes)]
MKYHDVTAARFLDRPNRFVAHAEIGGAAETVHVKNTGRCKELLLPGVPVILAKADNPNRKTRYDLIAVKKKGLGWVNIDSQAPNAAVREWLERQNFGLVRPEYVYGDSRIDFYMEKGKRKFLLEVKGCTLEIGGVGYFPDAPTERGVKHIRGLIKAQKQGYWCGVAFVIQMNGVKEVRPNIGTHPEFGEALAEAERAGVKVLCLSCEVRKDSLRVLSQGIDTESL